MVAGRLSKEACAMFDTATFHIVCTEIEPSDAGKGDSGRAHGAGLQGDVKVAVGKTRRVQHIRGGADGEDFRMGRGVVVGLERDTKT